MAPAAWDAAPPPWWRAGIPGLLPVVFATGAGELIVGASAPLLPPSTEAEVAEGGGACGPPPSGDRPHKRARPDGSEQLSPIAGDDAAAAATHRAALGDAVQPVASAQLSGQVFGAPVVFGGCVLVGARDDFLHCLVLEEAG